MQTDETFWARHPGLAWSNPEADDSVKIRAALLRPRFRRLLDIATEFGAPRVRLEWECLLGDEDRLVARARSPVERILKNIEEGFARADARS